MIEVVEIPASEFLMGDKKGFNKSPQHLVTVPAFFIAKTPITQAQYQAIMGKNPSYFKGKDRPVEQVSWFDAIEFCRKLSQETGQKYRLPSEAEWECACRAGTKTLFCFGDTITPKQANYHGHDSGQTTDVASFLPNAFGLYDMHGNVLEWCADNWHDNYEGAPTDGSAWLGSDDGKVLRGGSWFFYGASCKSDSRYCAFPDSFRYDVGFRVCL